MSFTKEEIDLAMKLSKDKHTSTKSPKECIKEAIDFTKQYLPHCCRELEEKVDTGILATGGYIRKLASLLRFEGNDPHALKMAEEMVKYEAILFVSRFYYDDTWVKYEENRWNKKHGGENK